VPQTSLNRPGGIGLDELEGLLERQERDKEVGIPTFKTVMNSVVQSEQDDEKNKNFIEFTIQPSRMSILLPMVEHELTSPCNFLQLLESDFFTQSPSPHQRRSLAEIATDFVNWGGFHEISPIENDTPLADEDLFGTSHIDHIRMRRAIRKWCNMTGLPNPYERTPGLQVINTSSSGGGDSTVEWEPLPGYEVTTEDVPIPSNVQATLKQPRYPPNR
jgi:hypothetical protein